MFSSGIQMSVFASAIGLAMQKLKEQQASAASYETLKASWNAACERFSLSLETGTETPSDLRELVRLTKELYAAKMQRTPDWQVRLNDRQFAAEFLSEFAKLHSLRTRHMLSRWDSAYSELEQAIKENRNTPELAERLLYATSRIFQHGAWIEEMFGTFGDELYHIWPQINEAGLRSFLTGIKDRVEKANTLVRTGGLLARNFAPQIYIRFGEVLLVYTPMTRRGLRHMAGREAEETAEAQTKLTLSFGKLEEAALEHVQEKDRRAFEEIARKVRLEAALFAEEVIRLKIAIKPELLAELLAYAGGAPKQNLVKIEAGRISSNLTAYGKGENGPSSLVLLLIAKGELRNAYTILVEELEKQSQELEERKKAELEKYYLKLEQTKKYLEQYYAKVESGILDIKKEENTIASAMLALALEIDSFAKKDIQLVDAMNRMAQRQA